MRFTSKIWLALSLMGLIMVAGCLSSKSPQIPHRTGGNGPSELGKNSTTSSNVIVEVNPNLELFSVLYILAFNGSDPFIIAPPGYIKDVLTYFAPYKNSEAVRYIQGVFNSSLPLYTRDDALMALSTRLVGLEYLGNITNESALGGDLRLLAEFARKSNFEAFYREHLEEYEYSISDLFRILSPAPRWYWRLFGKEYTRFKVEASYSVRIHPHSGSDERTVYYVGFIPPGMNSLKAQDLTLTVLHEFAHPFVEDFLDENFRLFKNMSYYWNEIKDQLPVLTSYDVDHYGTIYSYLDELFTESAAEYIGLKCGIPESYITIHRLTMSVPLFPISNFFEEYGYMEKSGMNLSEYAPVFARHMAEWATPENVSTLYWEVTPVTWFHQWDSIFQYGRVVIVPGMSENERDAAKTLKEVLERSYYRMFGQVPSIEIKAYDELTSKDTKANLILIGTPQTNEVVEKLNDRLPVEFVFNGSWGLKRINDPVSRFFAFKITNESVISLPLNAPVPFQWGLMETIKNPWGNNTYITVITGTDEPLIGKVIHKSGSGSYTIIGRDYLEVGFCIPKR